MEREVGVELRHGLNRGGHLGRRRCAARCDHRTAHDASASDQARYDGNELLSARTPSLQTRWPRTSRYRLRADLVAGAELQEAVVASAY
jgi:hypothetical protein